MTKNKPVPFIQHPASEQMSSEKLDDLNVRILTHNIRYANENPSKGEERWPIRCPRLCSELVFNSVPPATFICLQEVLYPQLTDILEDLNEPASKKDEWAYIGVGRDDGNRAGEFSPIFYRPSVWHLDRFETRWLSPTPDVPSKGWDADSIRIVTIGRFTHVQSQRKVLILNTHLDNAGAVSRSEAAKMILQEIYVATIKKDVEAVLLAGDFNSRPDGGAYQIMTAPNSLMEDVGVKVPGAKRYGNENTFTDFGHVDKPLTRIDFIFSRKGDKVRYWTYAVLANRFDDGVYSSDHRACVADVVLYSN